jgi:hypothetical protein
MRIGLRFAPAGGSAECLVDPASYLALLHPVVDDDRPDDDSAGDKEAQLQRGHA